MMDLARWITGSGMPGWAGNWSIHLRATRTYNRYVKVNRWNCRSGSGLLQWQTDISSEINAAYAIIPDEAGDPTWTNIGSNNGSKLVTLTFFSSRKKVYVTSLHSHRLAGDLSRGSYFRCQGLTKLKHPSLCKVASKSDYHRSLTLTRSGVYVSQLESELTFPNPGYK